MSTKKKTIVVDRNLAQRVLAVVDGGLSRGLGEPEVGKMCVEAAVCFAMGLPHSDRPTCVEDAVRSGKIFLNDKSWSSPQARAKGMRRVAIAQLGSKGKVDGFKYAEVLAAKTIRVIVPIALRAAASVIPSHAGKLEAVALLCERGGNMAAANAADAAAYAAANAGNAANAAYDAAYAAAYAAANAANAAYDAAYDAANAAANAAYAAAYDDANDAYDAAAHAAANANDAAHAAANAAAYAANAAIDAAYAAYAIDAANAANAAANAANDKVLSAGAEVMVQALIECGSPGAEWLDLAPLESSGN